MGLKTIPFRDIEEKAENMYEAVSAMSGQAKLELQERIVNKAILSHQEEELDVFDEVEEISPDSYEEQAKVRHILINSKEGDIDDAKNKKLADSILYAIRRDSSKFHERK